MSFRSFRVAPLAAVIALATSACGGGSAIPSRAPLANVPSQVVLDGTNVAWPESTSSILKTLKKDVVIGSTVDPKNHDKGPRSIDQVLGNFGLKKGQLVVCNYENSAGAAAKGTTIEVLDPKPGSKPATFVQNSKVQGCTGASLSAGNAVYAAGETSGVVAAFDEKGNYKKTYGSPIATPMTTADANCGLPYAPEDLYVGNAKDGSIVKFAVGYYGNPHEIAVIGGFDHSGSGWNTLGPSSVQYDARLHDHGSLCNDSLYIVDGVDNEVVAVTNASNLLVKDEIVVSSHGTKFTCKQKKFTCASVVYRGSALNAPVASAFLPNGNLIVANTKGGNTLVELTLTGKVLATKKIDSSKNAHVFGLVASGTKNVVLFYTDTADNSVHELEP